MRIEFNFTESDLRAFVEHSLDHDRLSLTLAEEERRTRLYSIIMLLVIGIAIAFESLRVYAKTNYFSILSAGCGAVLLWTAIDSLLRAGKLTRRQRIDYAMRQYAGSTLYSHQTVTLAHDGVTCVMRSATSFRPWAAGIESIAETPDHILLMCHPTGAIIIPRAAFASPADATAFAMTARNFLAHAGGSEHARDLLRYLALYDEPCPHCGYNLRAIAAPRCPECGRQVVGEDIPNFVKFGPPAPAPHDGASPRAPVAPTPQAALQVRTHQA